MISNDEKITNLQLIIMITGFTIGSSLVLPPGLEAEQNAWLAALLGLIEAILIITIFTILPKKFKRMSLIDIMCTVFGKYIGKAIFFLFTVYCFHLGSLVVRNFMDFLVITMMPEAPLMIFGFSILVACSYTVYKGIEVIARDSEILVPLTFIAVLITIILLFKDMKFANFKPFMDISLQKLLFASHASASFPFAETVVFLFIFPYLNNITKVRKSAITGVLLGAIIVISVVLRNTAVLGPIEKIVIYPSAQAVRIINVGNVLTRLEVIIFFNLITMGFIKISILLWCSVKGFSQLINLENSRKIIIPIAILMLIVATYQFESVMENAKFASKLYPLYSPFFQIGIPLLTLIVAKFRRLI